MRFAPALVASALALEASAFLVPIEISRAAEQAKSELAALLATTGHTVDLDCPGCPYFGAGDQTVPVSDVESKIVRTCFHCTRDHYADHSPLAPRIRNRSRAGPHDQ